MDVMYCTFFRRTKVLLNLTHLPLAEINNQYLISFIDLGHLDKKKILHSLKQIMPKKSLSYDLIIINGLKANSKVIGLTNKL